MFGGGLLGLRRLGFGLLHDAVHLLGRKAAHFHQRVRLDGREIVVGEEALAHEPLGQLGLDAFDRRIARHGLFDLLVEFLAGHDLDVPTAELAGQADVLAAPADGQRKLIFLHQHDRPAQHLAEDHFLDLGRLQGVGNQHLHVVAVADDVDAFAGKFVDDVLDAVAAHAHARPDAIDPLVGAADGDLGAVAGLAGNGADFDHALGDFGDFLLEQALHQMRLRAAENDLHAAAGLLHFVDRRPNALVGDDAFRRGSARPWAGSPRRWSG